MQVQHIDIVSKVDSEFLINVFKRKKKSKEQAIQRRQLRKKNLNRSFIKCDEPYQISRYVLGSYHQGESRSGSTAGMECSCIALFALCRLKMRKVSLWKPHDIDHSFNFDNAYKMLVLSMYLTFDNIPAIIELYGHMFHVH